MSLYFLLINISKDFLRFCLLLVVLVCFFSPAAQYLAWALNKYKLNR